MARQRAQVSKRSINRRIRNESRLFCLMADEQDHSSNKTYKYSIKTKPQQELVSCIAKS